MTRGARALVALVALVAAIGLGVLPACGGGDGGGTDAAPPEPSITSVPTTLAGTTTPVATTVPAPVTTLAPVFTSAVVPVTAADLGASWREGCPVAPDQLRRVSLTHWDFDGHPQTGALVVHADAVDAITGVFGRLFDARFPIRRMEPIDKYGGSDDASMAVDNTSAFNCRLAVGSGSAQWSTHAFGRALDVNPIENPYVLGGEVLPPDGAAYVDRAVVRPGMAVTGGPLVEAFAAAGWQWGGRWAGSPDYQHFSADGS